MTTTNIESTTWLDPLPTEIIFHIFNYLSSNDIIYTFFFFSQRFNNLLLQNQRYLSYLELPTRNLNLWEIIISHINSQIESLNITTIDLSFPLSLFPNLKSLIISCPNGLPNEQLQLILKSDQFNNLHSLKIKEHKIFSNLPRINYLPNQDVIFKKVFNNHNSLRTFQYSSVIQSFGEWRIYGLETNFNLYSLTLVLTDFHDIYSLIECTPNLNYLNITTQPFSVGYQNPIKEINIRLTEFYLKLVQDISTDADELIRRRIDFDVIMNGIKHLSLSSLICLSFDFVNVQLESENSFPINSIKLQQFLELMPELKQFHLYVKLNCYKLNSERIFENFNDQFWSDHNWSFGMQDQYFYTLPFHFDHLCIDESFEGFYHVKSNNSEILKTNLRLWYNVKIVDLYLKSQSDLNVVKELEIKLPKLTTIRFHDSFIRSSDKMQDLNERAKVQLGSVTTVHFECRLIERRRDWLIYALPNVKYLMLTAGQFPRVESELAPILDKRIEQLYIDATRGELEQLANTNYVYFSNVEHIHFGLNYCKNSFDRLADVVVQTLKNFQKLKTLTIYSRNGCSQHMASTETGLSQLVGYLNLNEITENYEMKHFEEYLFFCKNTVGDISFVNH